MAEHQGPAAVQRLRQGSYGKWSTIGVEKMNDEDAGKFLIGYLRKPIPSDHSGYGYDIYIPKIIRAYLTVAGSKAQGSGAEREFHTIGTELSPHFYAAAWELARRGILSPWCTYHGCNQPMKDTPGCQRRADFVLHSGSG